MIRNTVVFLTGAAGSLGSVTAKRLVNEGCKVCLFDLPDSTGQELAVTLGENSLFVPGDVTSEKDVTNALKETKDKFGNIRTVVNCAAFHRSHEVFNKKKEKPMSLDHLEMVLKVNVLGTMNVIRLAAAQLHENSVDNSELRGLIINTSGFASFDGQRGQTALAASWSAIEGLTLPLSREFGERGIRVMTISPGLMDSNLTNFISKKILLSLTMLTPSPKRLGRREEYADLVLTIMKNHFLNGEVIRLNGGLRLTL